MFHDASVLMSVFRSNNKVLIGVGVSLLLLVLLYSNVNLRETLDVIATASTGHLALSIALIGPVILLLGLRFYMTVPAGSVAGYAEAVRLTLVATAFNMFLPSKSGDLIKSYVVARRGQAKAGIAISIVIYERFCDLCGLAACCLLGWLIHPPATGAVPPSGIAFVAAFLVLCLVLTMSGRSAVFLGSAFRWMLPWNKFERLHHLAAGWSELHQVMGGRKAWALIISLALWISYMVQMWMFTLAIGESVPFDAGLGIFALAILAGQLPLTFAGFGTRDVALVIMLSDYMPPESAAAVALLSATLGFLPAAAAIPFMPKYFTTLIGEGIRWKQSVARRASRR